MIMKTINLLYAACLISVMISGCKKDNYKPPQSVLTGKVTYQGTATELRANGVQLELWQYGHQLFTKIPVYIAQDGSFSATLFDGDYKLVRLRGNGPWVDNTDSISISVRGNTTVDVPVMPYYTLNAPAVTFNKSDTSVSSTFTVTQVVSGRSIETVSVNVGATTLTDVINKVIMTEAAATPGVSATVKVYLNPNRYPADNQVNLRKQLSALFTKQYGFVRVGVKTSGVDERLYAPVQKIDLKLP